MNRKSALLISLFILAALVLVACGSTEVVKTVEVEVTRIVKEKGEVVTTPEPGVQTGAAYVSLASLAESIRAGEINVGDEFGMAIGQRFHTIHAQTVGMACNQCHVTDAPDEVAEAPEGSPGVVDRRVCVGCHLNGPATLLYEPKE